MIGSVLAASLLVNAPFGDYRIAVPEFAAREFPITEYGAVAGAGKCTDAIAVAMEECERHGGGSVIVPPGKWLTGAVRLRSNCNLHLSEGAELEFTDDPSDYLPSVRTSWEGVECYNYSPLVYAYGATNIAVTGNGELRARTEGWQSWRTRGPLQEIAKLKLVKEWGPKDVPIADRDLTKLEAAHNRPQFINFNCCSNIQLDGFRMRESPFWCIHVLHSDNVVLRGLDVSAHFNNSDGANFECSRNILVVDCVFEQGDDVICAKSGLDRDGRRRGLPTENLMIRRVKARSGHGLLTIGSECSGGVRNVAMEGSEIIGTCANVLNVKTRPTRGGFIENVFLRRVKVREVSGAIVRVSTANAQWVRYEQGLDTVLTRIDGLVVEDVRAGCVGRVLDVQGDARMPVRNAAFKGLVADRVQHPDVVIACEIRPATTGVN